MSLESTETSTESGFELLPPQTIDGETIVDDVRAVDPSYGGLLARHPEAEKGEDPAEANMTNPWPVSSDAERRRERAISWARGFRVDGDPVEALIANAKAIEAYLSGE